MDINNYLPNSGHHLEAGVHRAGCAKTPVTTCKNKKISIFANSISEQLPAQDFDSPTSS